MFCFSQNDVWTSTISRRNTCFLRISGKLDDLLRSKPWRSANVLTVVLLTLQIGLTCST